MPVTIYNYYNLALSSQFHIFEKVMNSISQANDRTQCNNHILYDWTGVIHQTTDLREEPQSSFLKPITLALFGGEKSERVHTAVLCLQAVNSLFCVSFATGDFLSYSEVVLG